jgi:hypothetical protein
MPKCECASAHSGFSYVHCRSAFYPVMQSLTALIKSCFNTVYEAQPLLCIFTAIAQLKSLKKGLLMSLSSSRTFNSSPVPKKPNHNSLALCYVFWPALLLSIHTYIHSVLCQTDLLAVSEHDLLLSMLFSGSSPSCICWDSTPFNTWSRMIPCLHDTLWSFWLDVNLP